MIYNAVVKINNAYQKASVVEPVEPVAVEPVAAAEPVY
jgi:hypothetical protein